MLCIDQVQFEPPGKKEKTIHNKGRFPNGMFGASLRPDSAALAILVLLLFLIFVFLFLTLTGQPAQAQSYKAIYDLNTFYGSGLFPFSGVTIDPAGNLYVTTKEGGAYGDYGTVFELSPSSSGLVYSAVYSFRGGDDGANPYDRVIFGPDGNLYGATTSGAGDCQGYGCGTVFELSHEGSNWVYTQLYRFRGGGDGAVPYNGDLVFDQAGNLYGTTEYGGTGCWGYGCGTVFELSPSSGGWIHHVLYRFTLSDDGAQPYASVILDGSGALYGVSGPVYKLTPTGGDWTFETIYKFLSGQGGPFGGLIFDGVGNLYGTTYNGGAGDGGTVFELVPTHGSWTYHQLHPFVTPFAVHGIYSRGGPVSSLTIDAAGNLYGTTWLDGLYGLGSVFKLTRSGRGWTYTSLHDFCSGGYPCIDGESPAGGVTLDSHGNLFGTTEYGGSNGGGVVWEITP